MSADNGGPAFPVHYNTAVQREEAGMTLRDYFAAKAMQGMIAGDILNMTTHEDAAIVAKASYFVADAMLAERAK